MATADYSHDPVGAPYSAPGAASLLQDPGSTLRRNLDRLATRRDLQRLWQAMVRALMVGVGISALAVLAYRFYLINGEWWMIAIIIGLAALIGLRNGLSARSGPFDAALDADRALGMQERLSSALAFTDPAAVRRRRVVHGQVSWPQRLRALLFPHVAYETVPSSEATPLVPALVRDAAARSTTLNPRQVYPLKFDLAHGLLLSFTLLLVIFCLMPNIEWFRSAAARATSAVLQKEGTKLIAIAKEVRKQDEKKDTEAKRMAKRVDSLGHKMQRGRMSKREALAELGQLKKDLEKATKNDSEKSSAAMQEAMKQFMNEKMESRDGQEMQEAIKRGDAEKAAQKLDQMADKLEKGQMSTEEKRKAANDLQKMAQALRKQGGQQAEKMAQQLERAARAMQQQGQQGSRNQQGQQGGQNQQGGQPQQQNSSQGGGQAPNGLRSLAKSMRQMGNMPNGIAGSSQQLRDLMNQIESSEDATGSNGQQSDKNGQVCPKCGKVHQPGGT
jgi:hypothetical protein